MTNAILVMGASAADPKPLTPIEALGKAVFFDARLSRPRSQQACASCHDPARGWVLPNAQVNRTTVVAPGAAPHAVGSIKTPSNAYASFSPPFASTGQIATPFRGGNFWDGRAEGCGAVGGSCPVGEGQVSATIRPADLPQVKRARYRRYLGPTADQALNPFPNPVEQNIAEQQVCREVQRVRWAGLYHQAFGEKINCATVPESAPPYRTAYKRLAVALAAWQSSAEVNSFSSGRDRALAADPDGQFPLAGLTDQENRGHDLFHGLITPLNPSGKNARCATCHVGVPQGDKADPARGEAPRELFTDNSFHNIGMPYNREVPGFAAGQRVGLTSHVPNDPRGDFRGFVRTPTLRNTAKGVGSGFVRAYGHNGWFKSLAGIVHFYNTRDKLPKCETFGLTAATEAEANARNCWPKAEFPNQTQAIIGNLALDADEEAALVAFLETLSDEYTPLAP
ncbi:MAG: cytochrome-c peroxidase [Geminicoccaceae bacterium]